MEGNLENLNILEKKNKKKLSLFFKFLIIFLIAFISFFIFSFSAPKNFPNQKNISIQRGENLRNLSNKLKKENLIRSRLFFETVIIFLDKEKNILPGDYFFEKKMSTFKIIQLLFSEDNQKKQIKITIPEGYTRDQIGLLFKEKLPNFNLNEFLSLTEDLEGYLFPDTYFFFSSDEPQFIIKVLKETFNKKIKKLEKEINDFDKNLNEIIIMASLIEKEAQGDSDRELIAGILWNRIKINMPLQVDAWLWTYQNKGLPLKPICNPGLKAIEATLKPTSSKYLYYLHDKKGNIYYAITYSEHLKNINKYLRKQ